MTPSIVIDDSSVMLQIIASLTDDSRGIIYDHNMITVLATYCVTLRQGCHPKYHTRLIVIPMAVASITPKKVLLHLPQECLQVRFQTQSKFRIVFAKFLK
jgi:hypothetical protein